MQAVERRLRKEGWVDTATNISVCRRTVDRSVTMHLHEYYELELVLDGCGEQNLNGSLYPLVPGTIYFLTPIDFHAVTPAGELKILNVAFGEELISPGLQMHFLNRREDLIFSSAEEAKNLTALVNRLERELAVNDAFSETARKYLLELLLFPIARNVRQEENLKRILSDSVQSSMQYLFRHFREDVTLAQVARQSGYTPNYFSHLFHAVCGVKFVDFLTQLRLNYARSLLLTTTAPVTQIAEKSGFSSSSNFFRAFRKETGLSPLEYRAQRNKGC